MKCPMCRIWEIKEPPWEEWYECGNCDWKPEHALRVRKSEDRVFELEKDNKNLRCKIMELQESTSWRR